VGNIDQKDDGAVVIIGSGAGGGTLTHELTRRGVKVVLLEAGKRQSLGTFSQVPGEAFGQLTWLDPRTQSGTWGVAKDFPTLPVWICTTVGGTTVHWTAATPRIRPWEIRARTTYGDVPGTSLIDWPIAYDELKNYYRLAERRLGVTRRNGNPGMPASNNFKVMYAAAKKVGYKRVHTNYMAINTRPRDDRGFFGGYHLELISLDLPTLPSVGLPYGWGRDFAAIMEDYRNMAGMFVCGEDLAQSANGITLDLKVKDAYGLPVAHVHVDEHANDKAMRRHAQDQAAKMYGAIGAKRVIRSRTPPATHNMCTARMSANPRDGVTNAFGQTHDIANLFVSDGSAFSTPGSANPTLTIVALALRQADYISRQMTARSL
jgi:choline dehydrogenase-like flavoprotein